MHWCSIVSVIVLCVVSLSHQDDKGSTNCPLQKGDKGGRVRALQQSYESHLY